MTSVAIDADGSADLEPFYSRLGKLQEYPRACVERRAKRRGAAAGDGGQHGQGRGLHRRGGGQAVRRHVRAARPVLNLKAVERIDHRTYLKQCINPPEHVSMATATRPNTSRRCKVPVGLPAADAARAGRAAARELRERPARALERSDVSRWQGQQQQQQQQNGENGENGAGGGDGGAGGAHRAVSLSERGGARGARARHAQA